MADDSPARRARLPWEAILVQAFTGLVTVGAVYLAATLGFEQTIRYTRYQEATDTLLILHVIRSELSENLRAIEEFDRYVRDMPQDGLLLIDRVFPLTTQDLDGALYNDMYFRMGPDLIISLRRFYQEARTLREYLTSNVKGVGGDEGGRKVGFGRETLQRIWKGFRLALLRARRELEPLLAKRVTELEETRREVYGRDLPPVYSPRAAP